MTALAWAGLAGSAQAEDIVVNSFDGTPIVAHWFPNPSLAAGKRAPVVLNGPGWSQPGENDPSTGAIKRLHDLGYNVLTWDPRGFGTSGGEATINAPQVEGRDVRALIDRMAKEPEVRLDKKGDPRVGMTGGSYGGGIQLSTAGIDRRIDAIVPVVAWHSLETSLYKDRTFKQGWNTLLYGDRVRQRHQRRARPAAPRECRRADSTRTSPRPTTAPQATGQLSAEDEEWFRDRGPGNGTISKIRAPTLLVGGTVDTLFPLDEDARIYRLLKLRGTPVKMFWFCGGHGQCAEGNGGEPGAGLDVGSILGSGGGDPRLEAASAAWLAHYLKGDESVDTGPGFEFRSDDGKYRVAPQYPVLPGKPVKGRGSGTLAIAPGATSGGATAATAAASGALNVPVTVRRASQLLGPPKVTITYSGTGTPGTTRVFAQLVNLDRGVVVGNQSAPIPVKLDGKQHTISRRLVPIASTAKAGARYQLQLVAGSAIWAGQRATGTLNASRISSSCRWRAAAAWARAAGAAAPRAGSPSWLPGSSAGRSSSGRVLLRGKRVARFGAGGKGGRFRFPRAAEGKQRLRLVLELSDGRTVKRTSAAYLCGPGS